MSALDEELKHLDAAGRYPVDARKATPVDLFPTPSQGIANSHKSSGAKLRRRWAIGAAIAAGLAALALSWHFMLSPAAQWKEFTTAVGEQRAIGLPDGSVLQLNTQSRVRVLLSPTERNFRLIEGEALFKVHNDPQRPFRVYTADAVIQALGTQFNVYRRRPEGTIVSVLEGRVQVSRPAPAEMEKAHSSNLPAPASRPTNLSSGEEAHIQADGAIERRVVAAVDNLAAWRQRLLVFKQTDLAQVTMEFNLYNRTPQFRVIDPSLAARLYSGVFDADDPQSLMELLEKEGDIALERRDGEILIRAR